MRPIPTFALLAALSAPLLAAVTGWTDWRGPLQTGASLEKGLPTDLKAGNELWTYDIKGGGTPVIADGNLYAFGFYGEKGEDTREALLCLDAVTGEKKWEVLLSDYISDVVYNRYGVGAPVVDPETGNVYLQTSNGRCVGYTRDGKQLWEISLIEEYGRLTFPNGRTGSPAVHGNLVIFHCVTANWGLTGPAQDRFYAFDKTTGEIVWYSSPGVRPVDSSFAMPVFAKLGGHDVFYSGGGDGNVYCVDANTGNPLWRFPLSAGGVNSQVILLGNDRLVAIHGSENLDASTTGRLTCIKIPTTYPDEQLVLGKEAEVWRNNDHVAFTSSPVLAEGKLFTTIATGELLCTEPETGKTLWKKKLAPDQIHASPAYGDGKLFVPMFDGHFFVLDPGDSDAEVLSEVKLSENCLGAPSIWAGKVYLITKSGIHCWGPAEGKFVGAPKENTESQPGEIAQLQIVPAEFALRAGESQDFKVFGLDSHGTRVKEVTPESWEAFIPPTAKVKAKVDATFEGNTLSAGPDAQLSAGAFKASFGKLSATTRGRVVAGPGYKEDFESVPLVMDSPEGEKVNFPPLPWLGARIKWYTLEKDESKVLANRLDNVLFQRTMNFFGDVHETGYTLQADVMTDGNRRIMSSVGLVNQRYLIALVGNSQILEVSSNYERVNQSVKFKIQPNTWYHLKTQVKRNDDGSGMVLAKAWPREEGEPEAWTIEVPVKYCHPNGAPGVFAFSPQAQKRVYIDNIELTKP
ncbi:serine/threonine protein kinase [Haloferula helveola]|uniref:Serine/threonine protein kinase n=1 Tax=Haloferula helveola TaxID=490095 RepID=A0ABM7RCZ0_9BACT|nr:serine/threonine protein kinase [Haloferula helveola]